VIDTVLTKQVEKGGEIFVRIRIDTDKVQVISLQLKKERARLEGISANLKSISNSIDFFISVSTGIKGELSKLSEKSDKQAKEMAIMVNFLQETGDKFMYTEDKLRRHADEMGLLMRWDGVVAVTALSGSIAMAAAKGGTEVYNDTIVYDENNAKADIGNDKKEGSVYSFTDRADTININAFGYEVDDEEVEVYGLKIEGDENIQIGAVAVASAVGITGLTAVASANASWNFFGIGSGSDAKEGFKVSGSANNDPDLEEYDGSSVKSSDFEGVGVKLSAEVGASVADIDYNTRIGTEDICGTVEADVKLLTAEAGAGIDVGFDEDGFAAMGKAEVGASVIEVGGSGSVEVMGVGAEASVSAEIGVGAYFEAGYDSESNEIVFGIGASLGIGGKVKFKIKLPKLW